MENTKLSQLIEEIYATPIEQRAWDSLVGLLAKAFNSPSCAMAMLDIDTGQATSLGFTANYTPSMIGNYETHYHKTDLWAQLIPLNNFGEVFVSDDVIPRKQLERSEFYNDWVKQIGISDVMGTILPIGQNLRGVFGIHRANGEAGFEDNDRAQVRLVIPHLTQAIRLSNRLNKLSLQQNAALEGLATVNIGMVIVDSFARVLFCNGIGEQLLASKIGLSVRSGRLYTEDSGRNPVLLKLIKDAAYAGIGRSVHAGGHMTLPNRDGRPATILISPLRPEHCESERLHPKAVIFIVGPNQRRSVIPSVLSQYYGLTPAEARLASALVDGERLQDYATRGQISLHTVKTQLKSIFAKTGATRQSDLVRDILTNPLLCRS